MQNELFPAEIRFTDRFKKDVKRLRKKYRSIQQDIEPFLEVLKNHQHPGDRLQEVGTHVVYKVRIKNSDNNKGQSGGYRVIYLVVDAHAVKSVRHCKPITNATILGEWHKNQPKNKSQFYSRNIKQ